MPTPRKSIEELKETGSYRPSRQGKREDAKSDGTEKIVIVVPKQYDAVTKKEFLRVSGYLKKKGILSEMDITSLYEAFNVFAENQRVYKTLQSTSVTDKLYKTLYQMYTAGTRNFNSIIKQFGAVPSERTKVSDLAKKEKPKGKKSILEILQN